MINKLELGYKGMSKDLAKDKQSDKYYNAKNIRILATDQKSSFSVTNEHGNELKFEIPIVTINTTDTQIEYSVGSETKTLKYSTTGSTIPRSEIEEEYQDNLVSGVQKIIGTQDMRDSAIIISTDDNGYDCFWELTGLNNGNFDLELKYVRNLNLSSEHLVQIEYNYENSIIQKIYFVDGNNQLRFMNLKQSVENGDSRNLIDVNATSIDTVSTFELSQVQVDTSSVISGGSHTSGMIQYAYALYVLNGSQTTISPLSELIPIDKGDGLGGGEVNEVLGKSVIVRIPNIDTEFSHVKIYSIKYTSLNQTPEIRIIADQEIDNYDSFNYYDDGNGGEVVSLEQFLFLGSDPITPKHIVTKDNILFPININEKKFDIELDARCYAHNSAGDVVVQENVSVNQFGSLVGVPTTVDTTTYSLPLRHDSINRDYELYKYQKNRTTIGGEGLFFKIEVVQSPLIDSVSRELRFLKDRELYRIGIVFYNRRGQESTPKWMMDLKAPEGNLEGNYNQLKVEIKPEFYTYLDSIAGDDKDSAPVGYRIVRADRQINDQTILTQGVINPMVANKLQPQNHKSIALADRKADADGIDSKKMPSMIRMFETFSPFVGAKNYHELAWENMTDSTFNQLGTSNKRETFKYSSPDNWRAQTFQFNKMMQMFTPEALFSNLQIDASYKLNVIGLQTQDYAANWSTETNPISGQRPQDVTFKNGITKGTTGVSWDIVQGNPENLSDNGFFGPAAADNEIQTQQVYRSFLGPWIKNTGTKLYNIYGSPEISETGADFTNYNNDPAFFYANNLKSMFMDDRIDGFSLGKIQIVGMNSNGAKCITFVEETRTSIEQMHAATGIPEKKGILIAEFVKDKNALYVGNVYGGFTFEAKSTSSYIGIGQYKEISSTSVLIDSPGDTYVQDFTFTKVAKDDLEITTRDYNLISEIVTIRVETLVDLKNRNDLSLGEWNNRFMPRFEEYQQYNRVYSQQPTLIQKVDPGFKFRKVNEFDARIMASKTKIPGENIDSWTDFLVNETMDLDGKYGPINAVVNSNDEVFCLQDNGVAHISINPRVQTTGADGIAIELGSGGILHDYQYVTTKSGCINKWGVIATQNGFYYIDVLNKAIVAYSGGIKGISDQEGFHFEFNNTFNYADLSIDNAVLGNGISTGYNSVNNDVYFSFHQSTNPFTIAYNEATGSFTSYYDYVPAWYINKGSRMITTDPTNQQLWEHFKGQKNRFYGNYFPSSIEFNASPPGKTDVTFNSAEFRMEMENPAGLDLPKVGLSKIRVYNEYQDSGLKNLELRKNMFKKNRNWKVNIPRVQGSRERIKNPWTFIEFIFENTEGNRMVLHDISVFYTEY